MPTAACSMELRRRDATRSLASGRRDSHQRLVIKRGPACHQVGEGRGAEPIEQGFLGREEHVMDVAVAVATAWASAQDAGLSTTVALDRLDDLEHRDCVRPAGEAVAAT